jgi:hypothetical protein
MTCSKLEAFKNDENLYHSARFEYICKIYFGLGITIKI